MPPAHVNRGAGLARRATTEGWPTHNSPRSDYRNQLANADAANGRHRQNPKRLLVFFELIWGTTPASAPDGSLGRLSVRRLERRSRISLPALKLGKYREQQRHSAKNGATGEETVPPRAQNSATRR
jgi:hypothetical protein